MQDRIIDVHAHIGTTVATGVGQDVEQAMSRMEKAGVPSAIICPAAGDRQADGILDTRRHNDLIAAALRKWPNRFVGGFGLVEPRHEEYAFVELTRIVNELGLLGIVMHPMFEGYFLNVARVVDPLFEVLDARRAVCLLHSTPEHGPGSQEAPGDIKEIAARFSNVTIVIGHPSISSEQQDQCVEIARDHENVYLDIAYQGSTRTVESLVQAIGSKKVVFGSDAPYFELEDVLRSVTQAAISEEDKYNILYGNVSRLLSSLPEKGFVLNMPPIEGVKP